MEPGPRKRIKLGELLIERAAITAEQLAQAREGQ